MRFKVDSGVNQLSITLTQYLRKSTLTKEDLFWLTTSEVSVLCYLALLLLACGSTEHHGRVCGRGSLFTSWQPGSKGRTRRVQGPDIPFKGHTLNGLTSSH
jgi:hypothetical protein